MHKRLAVYVAVIFFALSAVYLPVAMALEYKDIEMRKNEVVNQESNLADVAKTIMSQKTTRLVSDLLYVTDSLRLNENAADGYAQLKKEWLAFANRKRIYDQIRFIDLSGNEAIRINYSATGAYIVPDEELQYKGDRPYFTDTIGLALNEVYISRLDLNVEGDAVEEPIKPMIRLAMPYYDGAGRLRGIVILNYLANDILAQLKEVASSSRGEVYLLNADGYWLYDSTDSSREWAFMYKDRVDESFAKEYPEEWAKLQGANELIITQNGVFHATRIFAENDIFDESVGYSLVLGGGDFLLISRIPPDTEEGALFSNSIPTLVWHTIHKNGFVFLLFLMLAGTISVFLEMRHRASDKVRYFSEYDTMTGIHNRRAGLEKLQQMYRENKKTGQALSLCFIDINGLKEVNDHLGHEAGDELITGVVGGIRACIRAQDMAARLGGDEFLLVLRGVDEAGAEEIWTRISARYEEINQSAQKPYLVSASHGIEMVCGTVPDDIDMALNRADQKMYEEKRRIKQNFSVLRKATLSGTKTTLQ